MLVSFLCALSVILRLLHTHTFTHSHRACLLLEHFRCLCFEPVYILASIAMTESTTNIRDTKWVEGLRGLAAVFVMTSHIGLGYADYLEAPRRANQPSYWYNAPFVRIIFEGSPWVSTFLILTGFVNALKPLKQARSGNYDTTLAGLASSCFRRSLRLMLPCTVATIVSWIIAESGGYRTGNMMMNGWMAGTSPLPSGGVFAAICTLFRAILDTWSWNTNELERNQWAMLFFLKGALFVYVFLLATAKTQTKYRMCITAGLVAYGWRCLDRKQSTTSQLNNLT